MNQCAFSADSRSLASAGADGKIHLWDVAAHVHGEREPWEIINGAHLIGITRVDPR